MVTAFLMFITSPRIPYHPYYHPLLLFFNSDHTLTKRTSLNFSQSISLSGSSLCCLIPRPIFKSVSRKGSDMHVLIWEATGSVHHGCVTLLKNVCVLVCFICQPDLHSKLGHLEQSWQTWPCSFFCVCSAFSCYHSRVE